MRNSLIVPPPEPCALGRNALPSELRPVVPHRIAYLLDFDGTLVDLCDRPDGITLAPDLTATLLRLSAAAEGALAIITGRERAFVLDRLGTDQLEVVGLHGAEEQGRAMAPLPEAVLLPARAYARSTPGILAEDKGGAFALHYRLAPEKAPEVGALMTAVARRAGSDFRLKAGKSVWELCPAAADKGAALRRLMQRPPFAGRRPLAIGDDLTDEAMFAAANALDGFSVFVAPERAGPEPGTSAQYRLAAPTDVRALLEELAQ